MKKNLPDQTKAIAMAKAKQRIHPDRRVCGLCGKHFKHDDYEGHRVKCLERQERASTHSIQRRGKPKPGKTAEEKIRTGICPFCSKPWDNLAAHVQEDHKDRYDEFLRLRKRAAKKKAKKKNTSNEKRAKCHTCGNMYRASYLPTHRKYCRRNGSLRARNK